MEPADVIAQQHQQIQDLQAREHKSVISAAIGGALDASGLPLATGAREHLTKLLGDQLAVVPVNGDRVVMAPGGAAINEWVKAQLTQGTFTHFVRGGASPAAGGAPELPPVEPRNLSEAVLMQAHAQAAARPTGDPRLDTRQGFGLRPKK